MVRLARLLQYGVGAIVLFVICLFFSIGSAITMLIGLIPLYFVYIRAGEILKQVDGKNHGIPWRIDLTGTSMSTSGWAIAAGYAGMFAVFVLPAPVALILGIIALQDYNKRSVAGKSRAIFAIVMGAIFSLLLVFIIIAIVAGW